MGALNNTTITLGGTAQQLLPERPGRTELIIQPVDEDCWVNFGSTNAAVNVGELVMVNSFSRFHVSDFPEVGGRVSIFSATTGSHINYRDV